MPSTFLTALLLTTLAGLATTIGSIIGIFYKEPGPRYMAFTMGFSAGVMVLVSFVELLQQGIKSIAVCRCWHRHTQLPRRHGDICRHTQKYRCGHCNCHCYSNP